MSNNNQTLTEGNYLRIVVGLNRPFAKSHLLEAVFTKNSAEASDVRKTEKLKVERVIYVLCQTEIYAEKLKARIDNKSVWKDKGCFVIGEVYSAGALDRANSDGVVKIIDSENLCNLGNHVAFSTSSADGYELSIRATYINPPEWIPVKNGHRLRVHVTPGFWGKVFKFVLRKCGVKYPFEVRIIDHKLGEISYRTTSAVVTGTDLRVYGEHVRSENGEAIVTETNSDGDCLFEIKGDGLDIKDIRTSDVERITIRARKQIKIVTESVQSDKQKVRNVKGGAGGFGWWILLFVFEFLFLTALTMSPFWPFVAKEHKYLDRLGGKGVTNETSVVVCTVPANVKNTLSLQADTQAFLPHNSKTNSVGATATSISSISDMPTTAKEPKRIGEGRITFYFVLACLLYVIFYGVVVYLMVLTAQALKRCRKLHGNMQSVIDALRNERDKEKRREMQKKILDDMINTYLERPSSED